MKVSEDLHSKLGMPPPPEDNDWIAALKSTIARYVRGNTAAQYTSILLPSEQASQRRVAEKIAAAWEKRYKKTEAR